MKFRICLLSIVCCLLFAVQVDAGANANATISIDLVPNGGQGNQIDDGVTSGTVSGQSTKIVVEVFARGVTTQLLGVQVTFDFNTSLLRFNRAENNAFLLAVPQDDGISFADITPVRLSPSGFLARVEFTTIADVTGQAFSIGIKSVTLAESAASSDVITSSNEIVFNRSSTTNTLFQIVWPMDGDINYDGQVNIADFLLLVDNFGKTGVVPTSRMAIENALAAGGSGGTVITIRDTIYQTRTVRDTIYVGQDVGVGLSRIEISVFSGRKNWDGSDPDDDGIEVIVYFRNKDNKRLFAPEIVKVEVTLGKDNDRDDKPDVPLLLDRVVAVFSETDRKTTPYWRISQGTYSDDLQIRIPDEIYSHKLDITTDFSGDRQYGVIDVYVTTTSGTFSDRDDFTTLWKSKASDEK